MVSNSTIIKIAKKYKDYVEKNKKTPMTITVENKKYTYKQCGYLFSKFIVNPKKDDIKIFSISAAQKATGDNINENVLKDDYLDMAKRLNSYIENHKQLPNYLRTKKSQKKVRGRVYIYTFSRLVVYYSKDKALPKYVTIKSASLDPAPTLKKYGHATAQGCDNMGQNTDYYCGCHSLQEVFRNLTGKVVPQSTIARWAGTTTSGTGHYGMETAVAKFNSTYGFKLSVSWKNLSDIGWSGVKKLLESKDTDIVFHNLYRDQWGHYEVSNSISGSTVNVQNSLGSMCSSGCRCGYRESRSTGEFQRYMNGISQKSLMIITRK